MSKDRMQEAYKKMQRIYHKQHTQYIKVKFATSSFEYMYRKKNQQEMGTYGQKPI